MPTLEELQAEYNKSIQKETYLKTPENTDVNVGFSQPVQEQGVAFSDKDIYGAIGENVEQRRSRNQGALETIGIGATRLAGKTLTKTAEGAGFIAGLLGVDNNSENYGGGFSGWIAGAADNGLATLASDMESKLEDITPLYNSIEDKAANKVSVFNNLTDGDFWAGDAVDATAFLLSAYLTGGGVAELKVGQGLAKQLAKTGLLKSNLSKVAQSTNHLTATALQTASESMFEAKELRDNLREQIAKERFGSNFDFLTTEQQKQINTEVAPAAANAFTLNMALLAPSNLMEMSSLMKNSGRIVRETEGLTNKGLQTVLPSTDKLSSFQKFANTKAGSVLGAQAKNILAEGLYEENAQLAVSELLKANRDADLSSILTELPGKMFDNFETEEGRKSMLLGSLIGGISGTIGGVTDYNQNTKRQTNAINETNKSLGNMFATNDVYEKETYVEDVDGKPVTKTRYKLDENGEPIIDENKLKAVLKSKEEFEYLDDVATLAEEKGDDVLYGLAKNNSINRWIKSHFATGSEDLLEDKISYLQNLSDQEYLNMGLNPAEKGSYMANLRNKIAQYKQLTKNIENNLVSMDNSKKGSVNFLARKNELYNIGTALNDIKDEKDRLSLEQAEINSNEQAQVLNAKRLAYIDLKVNELTEAENKYKEEFNKLANLDTGQKYFNDEYKKSITKKVNSFDFEKGNLDSFNAFENSKLYKSGLELKARNIENDFFEKGTQERIENGEDVTAIADDLVADNVPVTKETKELLLDDLQFEKAALEEIQGYIQEMQYGEEPDPLSDYAQQLSDSFNNDFDAFNEYAAKIEKAIADVENLPLAEKLDTSKKAIKSKILEPFTNMVKGIVFTANTNEDYENVSEVENAIKSLENTIKVLEEKKDSDYDNIISEYKKLLEDLKAIQEVVKERVADKQRQQEKIAGQTLELQKDSLNSVPELTTLVSDITGLDISNLESQIKDLPLWEQIGYLTNIISQVKTQITPEHLQKLKNLEKSLTSQVEALVAANSKSDVLVNAVKKFYSKNPKLIFNDIVQLTIAYSKDRSSAYAKYLKDFNFYNLYEKVIGNDVQFRLPENVTHEIYNLHKQVLGVNNLIAIVESEYNPVTEIVTENAVGKEEKIVPSNQQLSAIRDLVRFLLTKKENLPFANFAYLKGFAGTGKTNIVLRWFTKVAALKQEEIFATGHNENSAKAINNSIGSPQVRSLEDLKYKLANNDLGKTKVIIIDEVNALNKNEIVEINELLVKYNQVNNTQIKIIGLGDPNQVTATGENPFVSPVYTPGLENTTVITPLTIRYRSNVQAVVDAQDLFMDQREDLTKQEIFLTSNPEKTLGAEASLQSDSIEKALATRDLNDGKTRAIIVHPSEVEMWKAKNLGVEVVSYVDVQGRTIDEVFVSIPKTKFGDVFAFNQAMYTATSRATSFIHINGMSSKNITDDNVNKITDKNVKDIEESKTRFEQDRVSEMKQIDESIEIKPAVKPQPEEEVKEEEEEVDVELEPELIPITPEEEVEVQPTSAEVLNLKYPNNKSLKGTTENGKDVPAVKPGENVIYVPFENRQGNKSIGIFVDRNGDYLEVGVLSEEELNNPPANKIDLFNSFKEALKGPITKFTLNNETGYLNVSSTSMLITLAKGKVENVSKLRMIYKQVTEPFNWQNLLTKFRKGFFTNNEGSASGVDKSQIRVFTSTEIADLKSKGVAFPLVAGRPYVMITNPVQTTGQTAIPQFIELERKQLNSETHNFITAPIYAFIDKYNKFKELFSDLTTNELADLITSSDEFLPKLLDKLNTKYKKDFNLSNDILDLRKEINDLLYTELTEEDKVLKKGMKVKNTSKAFTRKNSKGEIEETTGLVVKINEEEADVKIGDEVITVKIAELQPVLKRKPGPAQKAFNIIAQGNNTAAGYGIRLKYRSGSTVLTKAKSLLPRTEDLTVDEIIEKFKAMSSFKQQEVLNKFEEIYGRPIDISSEEDIININKLVSKTMSYEQLNAIFAEDNNNNISTLRVPIKTETTFDDAGQSIRLAYNENYVPTQYDALFFEDKLESVQGTSAAVTIEDSVKPNNATTATPPKPIRTRLKALLKSVNKELGKKLDTKSVLNYLKSIDKTLTADEVRFVTAAELMILSGGKQTWGFFKDGIIYLEQDEFGKAYENVARHELFHRIFDMMLTGSQKRLVYQKAIEEFGLPKDIELEAIEELLAEKYQEWRNNNKFSSFFTTLFNRIKRWLGMSVNIAPSIDSFFEMIESGYFSEQVDVGDTNKGYNDILKDFDNILNFKNAKLYIISYLHDLENSEKNGDNLEEYHTQTTIEKLESIYTYVVEEYNSLKEKTDLTEEEKIDLMFLSKLVNRKVYNSLIEDMFQGINLDKVSQEEIISSDWTDDIKDAEEVNQETKISQSVKQLLSTIINTTKVTQVNPRFAFLTILETFSNLNTATETSFKNELAQRFKDFYVKNSDVSAIQNRINELLNWAYLESYKGISLNKPFDFVTPNLFKNTEGKYLSRKPNESNVNFFNRIQAGTKVDLKLLNLLYLRSDARNNINELYAQAGSLYAQNVMYGEFAGFGKDYRQTFKNAIVEAEIRTERDNLADLFIQRAAGLQSNISKEAAKAAKIKSLDEKKQKAIDLFRQMFLYEPKNVQSSNVDDLLKKMSDLYEYYKTFKGENAQEDFQDRLVSDYSGLLSSIAKEHVVSAETDVRNPNYRRTDGKTAYKFTLSSFAINTIQSIVKNVNVPEYLKTPFYKNYNIFLNGLSKIHSYVNFDGIVDENRETDSIRYKSENEADWFRRNFNYFFLSFDNDSIKNKNTYLQQFVTISNKPNIVAAEVDILNWNKLEQSVLSILNQQSTRNFTGVKVNNSLNVFEPLVARKENETNDQYAKRIIETFKSKEGLTELLNTESRIDLKKLENMADKFANKDINELSQLFYANFFVNLHQLNQIVAGDEAFYKNSFDVVKRMSIAFATGYKGMVNNIFGLPKYYKTLVLKDIKGVLGDDYAKYKEIVGKSFDLTDAQGFMTSKRAEQLRRAYGTAFNFGSVIKPVHFEVDENGVPRAVKYSCVELTPELCAMFPILDKVRLTLENNSIDEVVFESAVKVGKPSAIQETLEDGSIDKIDPNSVITLQNSNYRIQGNPEHDVDGQDVAFPTQLGYFFNFSGLNTALAEKLFKAQEFLINNGLGNVIKELGIGAKLLEGESLEQNQNKQRDNVRKRMVDSQAEERDQRQNEFYANPKLGINTPFLVKKAITTMASMFKKATVAIKLPGAGLVLQSAYGTAIFKDAQGNEIERPLKWRDAEGFAEVVLPDFWQGQFQIGDSILFDTMVGFRIPATELHSAVPLKVVGFYPNNKNVVIAPPEIVFFHGSDYDVDKLYVMRREVYNKEIYSISGKLINDPKIPVGYSDNKFNELYADVLKTEILAVQDQINTAKNLEDADALKGLKTRLYDLKQLQDVYYKNFIVDLFVQVTTAKVNENLMMAPISMERFKGVGIDAEQSAFDLVAELKGFKEPKPNFKDFTTLESYENAVEEWKDKRDAVIYTKRSLYDLNDQMLMHKDNFSGTKLTGSFANMAKVIAYFFQSTSDNAYPKLKESYHITLNGKTYEGFDYYENTKEVLVAYDSEGKPVYKKPSITETIDSLINAAIDNVKEQILPVIGFTNNTGGAAVSMISMGIPLNEVVMTMLQPAVNTINKFTSYSIGYSAALNDLKQAYAVKLKAESFSALTEDQQKAFDEDLPEVSVKDMKAMFGKEISDLSEKEIKLQLAILRNVVNKANNTSDYITTASTAYSVLKEFPIDFPGMENVLEAFDKMWTEGKVVDPETGKEVSVNEASETFPFTNVVPHKLPHINAALKTLKTLKSKVEHLFFAHYKTLQGFSNTILPKYGLGAKKASKDKEVSARIRERFLQYFMSGLSFTTPEGYTVNLDTSKEPVYTDARGKEYSGMDAWLRRFSDQLREVKKANPDNKFLRKLSMGKKYKVNFNVGKNLSQEDFIDLQLEFDKLKDDGKFTEFQYELVKYSIIQQGLAFGSNNYSLVLPSTIYEPFMEKYNEEMNKYTSDSELYNTFLNQVGENFILQYSMNNAKEVVKNVRPEDAKEGPNRSILVSRDNPVTGENPPTFVRSYSTLYTLLALNPKYPNDYVYARVGDFNQISGYQFNTDIIGKQYDLQDVFNIDIPTIPVTNNRPKNGIFESLKEYSVGQKIRLVNYSDYTRMNLVEYTIAEKTTKGNINTYVLSDSQQVNEIMTDDQIVNSSEYQKLIEEGYTGEAALQKIKNKC